MAVVAEWLRRLTRNQIPSGSVGSNPTGCVTEFYCDTLPWTQYHYIKITQLELGFAYSGSVV